MLLSIWPIQKGKLDHFTAGSEPALVQESWSNRFSANFHSLSLSRRKSINLSPEEVYAFLWKEEEEHDDEEVDNDDGDDDEETESFCSVFLSKWISISNQIIMHFLPSLPRFYCWGEFMKGKWQNVPLEIRRRIEWWLKFVLRNLSYALRLTPLSCCIPCLLPYFFDKFVVVENIYKRTMEEGSAYVYIW